jgi:hypothetical protein
VRGGAIAALAWALLLAVLLAGNWVWTGDALQVAEFGFAVLVVLVCAATVVVSGREALRPGPPEPREEVLAVSDLSVGSALAAVALALAVFGLAFGSFLYYIGGGLLALAAGRLTVEARAERRARALAASEERREVRR